MTGETPDTQHHRGQAFAFLVKSRLFQARRLLRDAASPTSRHRCGNELSGAPVVASHRSFLWPTEDPAEADLTAGKVENLRLACRRIDGLEIPAGQTFSFWRQLGRTTRLKGYVPGRELREGCIMPNIGGGLCQLSNALYDAALQGGFTVTERHAHSKVIPGSLAALGRDATVFWNYVDLRFVAPMAYRIEASLSKDHLLLNFRAVESTSAEQTPAPVSKAADTLGNCLTCNHGECFRSNPIVPAEVRFGKTAFLLDAYWPEHDQWCLSWAGTGALYLTPLDGHRWHKPNYAWTIPPEATHRTSPLRTLRRSRALRGAPAQGASLQTTLLHHDEQLAKSYARQLDYTVKHLVISQNLLPHLWQLGALGGRTYDVLMTRWPMGKLQELLDEAAVHHPQRDTLTDFRASDQLVAAERSALAQANHLVTPHTALAAHLTSEINSARVELVPWHRPELAPRAESSSSRGKVFFPASPLARKGAFELGACLRGLPHQLLVLGRACETTGDPFEELHSRSGSLAELPESGLVVLPSYVENQPRALLTALAHGIPVVATKGCGLPPQPLLTLLDHPQSLAAHHFGPPHGKEDQRSQKRIHPARAGLAERTSGD